MTLAHDLNQPSTEAALSVLAASGWSLKAIAREWDLSRAKLVRIADRAGIDFSNANLDRAPVNMSELERLYRKGMSLAEIGRRLGVSDDTVIRRLIRAGLRGAKPRAPCKFCHAPAKAKGMCHAHYMRERRAMREPAMSDMDRVRAMCAAISVYLYSTDPAPQILNDLWLAFVERGHVPTADEWRIYRSSESARPSKSESA